MINTIFYFPSSEQEYEENIDNISPRTISFIPPSDGSGAGTIRKNGIQYGNCNGNNETVKTLTGTTVDGVRILTQEMFNAANFKYIINRDFNLQGRSITIPSNCILQFEGGSIQNGTINGQNTQIIAPKQAIFDNITISGTWNVPNITSSWFLDASSNDGLKNVFALQDESVLNQIVIEAGDYSVSYAGKYEILECKSNLKLIINGHITLQGTSSNRYYILSLDSAKNVIICGSGTITGDRDTHIGETGEHGMGIAIMHNSSNIKVEGIFIEKCWGDGIYIGNKTVDEGYMIENVIVDGVKIDKCRRQGISITEVTGCEIRNCTITNIDGTNPQAAIDIEPNDGHTCKNIIIENNIINNCTQGILALNKLTTKSNFIFRGNSISCYRFGIRSHYLMGQFSIESNNILCKRNAIFITGDDHLTQPSVINNVITTTLSSEDDEEDTDRCAIFIWGARNSVVSGNQITTDKQDAIYCYDMSTITGNKIVSNANLIHYQNTHINTYNFKNNDIEVASINPDNKDSLYFYNNIFHIKQDISFPNTGRNMVLEGNRLVAEKPEAEDSYGYVLNFPNTVDNSFVFSKNYVYNLYVSMYTRGRGIVSENTFDYGSDYITPTGCVHFITCHVMFINNIVNIDGNINTNVDEEHQLNDVIYSGSESKAFVSGNVFNLNNISLRYLYHSNTNTTHFVDNIINDANNIIDIISPSGIAGFRDGTYARTGSTDNRPALPNQSCYVGFEYFDTTVNKPLYWNGTNWVDAIGQEDQQASVQSDEQI